MTKRFSLSRLLHNDKLMMVLSVIAAIVIWALVVYGPSNEEDQVITGVPVSVTLNDYASQTLNLRITDGTKATATVTVHGLHSVVSKLTAADLSVTADTGNVIKEGTYTLPLKATAAGDYTIRSVVGENGNNDTITISCDVWKEASFTVETEIPGITLLDDESCQFGTPIVSGTAVADGEVTASGPKSDINKIARVVASVKDTAAIGETTAFSAALEARDAGGNVIGSVSFIGSEDGLASVTVPVMVYRKVDFSAAALHVPEGYANTANLVTVSPSFVEIWGIPSEIDDFVESINALCRVDFDALTPDNLTRQVYIAATDGIKLVNGNEMVTVKVNLNRITTKSFDIALNSNNVSILNCPAGYTAKLTQTKLTGITVCGTSKDLNAIQAADFRITVDMAGTATAGQQTLKARITVDGRPGVWVCYGTGITGADLLTQIEAQN